MRTLLKLSFLFAVIFLSANVLAQKSFEGTITFEMEMDLKDMPPEAAAMMKGSEIIYTIKDASTRVESKTPIANTAVVVNNKKKNGFTLMEMMGSKYLIKLADEDFKKDTDRPNIEVKYTEETKEIAGYKCKKAEVTIKDTTMQNEYISIVYYTTEIPYGNSYGNNFKGLKGFPLEYNIQTPQPGSNVKVIAKKVSKEKVEDSIFSVPTDVKEFTQEEFQKEMMKNFGGGGQ